MDGASYESAEVAVAMKEPAMRITMAIEAKQDPTFIPRLIELLAYRPLEEIVAMPFVASQIPPLLERHQQLHRDHPQAQRVRGSDDLLRRDRIRPGGLQQVHPLLSASGERVQRGTEQEQLPGEDLRGLQPVDRRGEHDQPGEDLRALRRRRTCAGGRHQLSAGRVSAGNAGRAGDRARTARYTPQASLQ